MSERQITTRQIFNKWHAYCGCGGWWSGAHDTKAEAVQWIEQAIADGSCQCRDRAASVGTKDGASDHE